MFAEMLGFQPAQTAKSVLDERAVQSDLVDTAGPDYWRSEHVISLEEQLASAEHHISAGSLAQSRRKT